MSAHLHLQLAGALILTLSIAHIFFWRYFRWSAELAAVSLLTRQVFGVHTFFIALVLAMFGGLSLWETDALLDQGSLGRSMLASMLCFWVCRLGCQWLVYDRKIWRRRPLYTAAHIAFSVLWGYLVFAYGVALWAGADAGRPSVARPQRSLTCARITSAARLDVPGSIDRLNRRSRAYCDCYFAVQPPSMRMSVPVMNPACSEQR